MISGTSTGIISHQSRQACRADPIPRREERDDGGSWRSSVPCQSEVNWPLISRDPGLGRRGDGIDAGDPEIGPPLLGGREPAGRCYGRSRCSCRSGGLAANKGVAPWTFQVNSCAARRCARPCSVAHLARTYASRKALSASPNRRYDAQIEPPGRGRGLASRLIPTTGPQTARSRVARVNRRGCIWLAPAGQI
jgi:hypothetical protein